MSTAFHPQIDSKSLHTIDTLEFMLSACVIAIKGSWDHQLPFIEFTDKNNYLSSIHIAPYEVLCWKRYRSPIR